MLIFASQPRLPLPVGHAGTLLHSSLNRNCRPRTDFRYRGFFLAKVLEADFFLPSPPSAAAASFLGRANSAAGFLGSSFLDLTGSFGASLAAAASLRAATRLAASFCAASCSAAAAASSSFLVGFL